MKAVEWPPETAPATTGSPRRVATVSEASRRTAIRRRIEVERLHDLFLTFLDRRDHLNRWKVCAYVRRTLLDWAEDTAQASGLRVRITEAFRSPLAAKQSGTGVIREVLGALRIQAMQVMRGVPVGYDPNLLRDARYAVTILAPELLGVSIPRGRPVGDPKQTALAVKSMRRWVYDREEFEGRVPFLLKLSEIERADLRRRYARGRAAHLELVSPIFRAKRLARVMGEETKSRLSAYELKQLELDFQRKHSASLR